MSEQSTPFIDVKEPLANPETAFTFDQVVGRREEWEQNHQIISPPAETVGQVHNLEEIRSHFNNLMTGHEYFSFSDRMPIITGEIGGSIESQVDPYLAQIIAVMDADFRKKMGIPLDRILAPNLICRVGMYQRSNPFMHIDYVDSSKVPERSSDELIYVFSIGAATDTYQGIVDHSYKPALDVVNRPRPEVFVDALTGGDVALMPSAPEGSIVCFDGTTVHAEPTVTTIEPRLFMRLGYDLSKINSNYDPLNI